ncbi:hypothetical protein [Mesorhizobium sp.]|uniref:hypothetical protein n=1 Tax=Mesorhizobium sp. TaxID=1871066 RepID=UPI000FE5BE10|nr:hypothetical protein [Mesorhizobium sp.]RWB69359.1 MAG: hypothetical protein EOQ49_19985 [Mesorhizobium sp.]
MTNRVTPQRSAAQMSRTKGFAIAIDYLEGRPHDARLIDKSPVLFPEKVVRSGIEESGHRRFGLVEYAGVGEPSPSGLIVPTGVV